MPPKLFAVVALLVLALPFVTAAHWSRRHQEVAYRARGDAVIYKRQSYSYARFTFYDVGLGACGWNSVASDWVVALNVDQYGSGYPGPMCGKSITIQYGGKTAQAIIVDECMGCPFGGLDFSRGLFDYFAPESVGVLSGTWWFDGGSGGGGDQSTSTSTSPTTTWEPPATTSTPAYTPPATSSTPVYASPTTSSTPAYTTPTTTSTTSTTSTHSTSSTSSNNFNISSFSGLAVPTGGVVSAPNTSNPQNIFVINNILVEVGIVLSAADYRL